MFDNNLLILNSYYKLLGKLLVIFSLKVLQKEYLQLFDHWWHDHKALSLLALNNHQNDKLYAIDYLIEKEFL